MVSDVQERTAKLSQVTAGKAQGLIHWLWYLAL